MWPVSNVHVIQDGRLFHSLICIIACASWTVEIVYQDGEADAPNVREATNGIYHLWHMSVAAHVDFLWI